MEPITIFKNQEQARECLNYYKTLLNLDSWIIDVNLKYDQKVIAPAWGNSHIFRAIHTSIINIPMPKRGQINTFPQRYCQELILAHEVMHIRLPTVEVEIESTEGEFYNAEQHATLELIAKGIIMAKYGLTMQYFENF